MNISVSASEVYFSLMGIIDTLKLQVYLHTCMYIRHAHIYVRHILFRYMTSVFCKMACNSIIFYFFKQLYVSSTFVSIDVQIIYHT